MASGKSWGLRHQKLQWSEPEIKAEIPPPTLLVDAVIELRLLRVLGLEHVALRPPQERFLCQAPEYRFAIHRRTDDLRVGRIHLRLTDDEAITGAVGHIGYAVDAPYRRNGYATRAIRLVVGLARHYDVASLWVLIEPENVASRRVAEKAGFQLRDVVDTQPAAVALGVGPQVCRYVVARP